ncbi:N-acetylmuramoyl-L-alanine amidase [Streptomyces sp. NPDC015346]|uniref:peptidoglycan recognition protein family protein n=1 Tax=Streptomyces sp. NPDC015346 TaxID=3364954 RepID=UPI003701ED52
MPFTDPHPAAPGRRSVLTGAFALTAGVLIPLGAAAPARAAGAAGPVIADCAAWDARPPSSPVTVLSTPPQKIIVHHTATPNTSDYSAARARSLARGMQRDHMDRRGWADTGQHFTISRGAHILEGRHQSLAALREGSRQVESAHCHGQNSVAVGIENEGDYTSTEPRHVQYAALVDLCAHICRRYGLRPYQIYGHRDFNATDCPGDRLYALLPRLRRDVAAVVGGDPTAPTWPVVRRGDSGSRVRALQHLLVGNGRSLTVDGSFGADTETAVRDVQTGRHATVDGVAAHQVWHQLVVPVERGESGATVRAVQTLLASKGAATAVDGMFGSGTRSAVTAFQNSRGLPADGVADARTWGRLLG